MFNENFPLIAIGAFICLIFLFFGLIIGDSMAAYREYKKGFEYGWELRGDCGHEN